MGKPAEDRPFSPVNALRDLEPFRALRSALLGERRRAAATGLYGSSAGLVLAALAVDLDRPVLAIAATPEQADALEDDLKTFLADAACPPGAETARREVLPFPAYDVLPGETDTPEMPVLSARLSALRRLAPGGGLAAAVAPLMAVLQPVPAPEALRKRELVLRVGEKAGFGIGGKDAADDAVEGLTRWLFDRGLERVPVVSGRGEFAVRGGIVDLFPLYSGALVFEGAAGCAPPAPEEAGAGARDGRAEERPVRIEFDSDTVASMRTFDPVTQRSLDGVAEFRVPGVERTGALDPYTFGMPGGLADHLDEGALVALVGPAELERAAELCELAGPDRAPTWRAVREALGARPVVEITAESGEGDAEFDVASVQRVAGRAEEVAARLAGLAGRVPAVWAYCRDATEEARLAATLRRAKFAFPDLFEIRRGRLSAGFEFRDLGWAALADHEILAVTAEHRRVSRLAQVDAAPIADFLDLAAGDYVVHSTHGIARYLGLARLRKGDGFEDYLALLFADKVKLYVPAGLAYLVERYVGAGEARPALSRIGGKAWVRSRQRAAEAVRDIAADLIATQAERMRTEGLAYPPDDDWQVEFESAFPYEETADQLSAARAIKLDMERPVPMDRLLCGDVGFGKTEVAMRGAFKAVAAGRQVAVLVPTTLLADQHEKTFAERLGGYPVRVESLSRFKTGAQARAVLRDLEAGLVDIAIGTHRLLGADVRFRDLGLIIIDEEQRFGVEHKEKLKRLRLAADVLALSATPIPRTLHMSLVGLRDISNLTIPPEDRLSIRTKVCRWSDGLVRRAILREMARGGQVYFVTDRVIGIGQLSSRLGGIVPEARIGVVHGQMHEKEISSQMARFLRREVDVLVTTTIIESGLDIPTVNTCFVNNADRFGLAELHQLRGRVGRYRHQAFAYLLVPDDRTVSPDAVKRLRAVEEFAELGAGFKLAMRDLEIRGAGNLLGVEQSGRIAEVGYELYCRLLERAVRQMKGETVQEPVDVTLVLGWGASIPPEYVPDESVRLEIYRKLARARGEDEVAAVGEEMRDRFGPLPAPAGRVLAEARIRLCAQRAAIPYVERELKGKAGRLVFKLRSPEFRRIEKALRGLPGEFTPAGDEGFNVHLPAERLEEERLEETVARVLARLAPA